MTEAISYVPAMVMLVTLSIFVTILTNLLRQRERLHLRHEEAAKRMWLIYLFTLGFGIGLAALLQASIFDILKNPDNPAIFFSSHPPRGSSGMSVLWHWLGIIVTGTLLAFLSRFWNDVFDMIYEVKRWLRLRNDERAIKLKAMEEDMKKRSEA
jgi:hypothetical protein